MTEEEGYDPNPRDSKDTAAFGVVTAIATSVLFFFIFRGINWLLIKYYFNGGSGVSEHFIYMMAVLANVIPMRLFTKHRRDYALRGLIGTVLLMVFLVLVYFKVDIFG